MPALTPKPDAWVELKADYGSGVGRIPKGAQLQVTHVVPYGERGHGVIDDDVVLLRFLEESVVTGRVVQRRLSVRKREFAGMFKTGSEPAELARWNDAQRQRETA
jgi:hypothetical protein